ncbi:MAG: hypothetical protein JXB49_36740, partial [Bacteroidales bacterium]|nr:hypothetical protein [Bacteroidales bacterium]
MRNPVLFLTVISLVLLTTVNCHKKNSTEPEQTKETPTVQNDFKVEVEYTTEQVTLVLFSYGYANSVWQTLSENVQSFECNAGETINSITIDVSDEDEIIVIWELHDIVFNCKVDGSSCSRSWYSQGQICEYFACYYDVGTIKETISISITLIGEMPELNATVPVLTTADIGLITQTTARCGGTITSDGGGTVTTRGVCWSTDQTPTVSDNKTNDGTGEDTFTSDIAGLIPGTTYYVRAYATNIAGTGYGSVMSFTTEEPKVPVLTTADIG